MPLQSLKLTNVSLLTLVVVMIFSSPPRLKLPPWRDARRLLNGGLWRVFPLSVCHCEFLFGLIKPDSPQRRGISLSQPFCGASTPLTWLGKVTHTHLCTVPVCVFFIRGEMRISLFSKARTQRKLKSLN